MNLTKIVLGSMLFLASHNMVSASPNITDVQKALNDFGYSVEATGEINEETQKAIMDFQKSHNLEVNGELNDVSYMSIMGKEFPEDEGLSAEEFLSQPPVFMLDQSQFSSQERTTNTKSVSTTNNNGRSYNGSKSQQIISYAKQFEGVPYVWGGSSPNGFDCSGFVQYVFAQNGIKLPRTADYQANVGTPIDKSQLQPGDLVFFAGDHVNVSHVGIYIGNGQMIHASSGKHQIDYDDLSRPYRVDHYHSARRIL